MSHAPHKHTDARWPETPQDHCVVVLGASAKPARYSNQAVRLLKEHGYQLIPVHPRVTRIEGLPVAHNLRAIHATVHTLTLYVGPERARPLVEDVIRLNPGRVVFNPGTEAADIEQRLSHHGIRCVHGCTLVMLRTNQF